MHLRPRGRLNNNIEMVSDEEEEKREPNCTATPVHAQSCSNTSSPLTPLQNIVMLMRKRLEQQFAGGHKALIENCDKLENGKAHSPFSDEEEQLERNISPGLARLRTTPGRGRRLRDKQKVLEKMHQHAKENSDQLSVGGGVSIWPEMTNMRLDRTETGWLVITCVGLATMVLLLFNKIHGDLFRGLIRYTRQVSSFSSSHPLVMDKDNATFRESLLVWHVNFMKLMDEMDERFHISLSSTSLPYKACVVLYILAISVLLYYLVDNILARSKLSPRRIKLWVSLLVVTGGWTLLLLQLLILAQALESSVEETVHDFSQNLGHLVLTDLDLVLFRDVSSVWRVRCLPPSARGVLSVMGVVRVRDVTYYLQYYSVPVVTALLTPVVQLVIALRDVYSPEGGRSSSHKKV